MSFKNTKADRTTFTRNTRELEAQGTGNLFETIVVLSRRSNQLSKQLKEELSSKLEEFITPTDSLEEVFENREQIEISKFYERLPKPHSVAVSELQQEKLHVYTENKEETAETIIKWMQLSEQELRFSAIVRRPARHKIAASVSSGGTVCDPNSFLD